MSRSASSSGSRTEAASRPDRLAAAALTLALFGVYAAGASRTIYVGDSGELVTAVYLLGIPHPSGYPLYVLLGKLWTLLVPAGSIAFRMSLFSAACSSAAAGGLYLLCRAMRLTRLVSVSTALLFAFGPSFWSQANIQRVYALDALFIVLAMRAAWRWYEGRRPGALVAAFFLCGLGATNHLFMALLAVCLAIFAAVAEPGIVRRWKVVGAACLACFGGLLVYLYLPIRSLANPRLDWGNPETLHNFIHVILREDFWGRRFYEKPSDLLIIGWDYLKSFGPELAWAGAVLALIGLLFFRRRWGKFVLLPVLAALGNAVVMALHGSRTDLFLWHRYYIPSYLMAALLAGWGAQVVLEKLPKAARPALLILPAALVATGWRQFDRSRYAISESFSKDLFRAVSPGANLIATDDNILFTSMYLHFVQGLRPDVNLILQGVGGIDLPALKFDPDTNPLYFTHNPNWNFPQLDIVPLGLVFRACRAGKPRPDPVLPPPALDGELDPRVPKDYLTQNLIGQFHYMLGVTFEDRDWRRAVREFDLARKAASGNDVLFYNLGLIDARNGLLDRALEDFERCKAINPRHLASLDRPEASTKIDEVKREMTRIREVELKASEDPEVAAEAEGSAGYELAMARVLERMGEPRASRGHLLEAIEKGAVKAPDR